jgi:O-antigen/teichoic acid export membrane protein
MISRKISFLYFANIIHMGLGYVSLFFVARFMGPAAIGIIAFAESYIGMFSPISELGYAWAHVKRISEGKDLGVCIGTYFTVKILLTTVMTIVILATVFVSNTIFHKQFVSHEHEVVLYVMLVVTLIGAFSRVIMVTFQARKETAKQTIPWLTEKFFVVAGKVAVAIAGLGVILLASASLLGAVISLLFLLYLFRGYPVKRPTVDYFRSYTKFALPVMFIGILPTIAQNVDKIMIQFFYTATDVGYYAAVQRISFVIEYIGIASVSLLFPTISTYYSRKDVDSIRILSHKAERYLSMILFPFVTFLVVFSVPVCRILLGSQFIASAPILAVLAFMSLVHTISQPYTQQLGGTDNIKLAAKISSFVFVVDIILNFIFIPDRLFGMQMLGLGGFGAALSTLISAVVGVTLFRIAAYKLTASKPNKSVLTLFIVSFVVGLVLFLTTLKIQPIEWYELALLVIGATVMYCVLLFLVGEFTKSDIVFFKKILSPGDMTNYIVGEMKSGCDEQKL